MSHYEKKRLHEHSQHLEPAHKRHKGWTNNASDEQPVTSANDRFASSVYKGRTLINKTPQKIVFGDDAPSTTTESKTHTASKLSSKKSVTFTPETKHEDGASGQAFSKMWLAPAAAVVNRADAAVPDIPTPTKEPPKPSSDASARPKSHKQPKKSQKSQRPPDDHEAGAACVAYIELFHNDHKNWKFNKVRQSDLLRRLWNIEAIPSSHNDALAAYIKGLTGAAAQQRLADGIVKILDPIVQAHSGKLGELPLDTAEQRRDAYDRALKLQQEHLEAQTGDVESLRLETEQAERAALLMRPTLWQLLRSEPAEEAVATEPVSAAPAAESAPVAEQSTPQKAPAVSKRKSRKSRTATYSSSESSSDDSDSSSDSD